mgnify:CR=1 FL=1
MRKNLRSWARIAAVLIVTFSALTAGRFILRSRMPVLRASGLACREVWRTRLCGSGAELFVLDTPGGPVICRSSGAAGEASPAGSFLSLSQPGGSALCAIAFYGDEREYSSGIFYACGSSAEVYVHGGLVIVVCRMPEAEYSAESLINNALDKSRAAARNA